MDEEHPTDGYRILPEFIRKRPSLFIGGTDTAALHGLANELISFSVEEIGAGYGKSIHVHIHVDGSLTVADDGRAIPVEIHPQIHLSILELVMTVCGTNTAVDWFRSDERMTGAVRSLHGIGARAITALSDWAEAVVYWKGRIYQQQYQRGHALSDVCDLGDAGTQTGTKITFHPDPEIFHDVAFEWHCLEARLRERAFVIKGLAITLRDDRSGREERFKYENGIADLLVHLNRSKEVLHKPISIEQTVNGVKVEAALQYTNGEEECVRCYANSFFNPIGGTHLTAFHRALTRTLNHYGRDAHLFKAKLLPKGVDFRKGLTAVVSVQLPEPMFESQNKLRLHNPDVEAIVAQVIRGALMVFLNENPTDAERILKKAIKARESRITKTLGRRRSNS